MNVFRRHQLFDYNISYQAGLFIAISVSQLYFGCSFSSSSSAAGRSLRASLELLAAVNE